MAVADSLYSNLARWMSHEAPANGPIGVGVSGGGDSLALMLLLARWADEARRVVTVATVDHNLRPDSAAEAEQVAIRAGSLGLPHEILCWTDLPVGNLQDAARRARTELLAAWAQRQGISAIALGHTMDDQAETFLLRLARGSGVDGLGAMSPVARREGVTWLRPLLSSRRQDLRDFLTDGGETWVDDPGNDDPRFDRIKMRAMLPALEALGLGVERISQTSQAMRRARHALDLTTAETAAGITRPLPVGAIEIDREALRDCTQEIRLRLLARALCWIGAEIYRPRLSALEALAECMVSGEPNLTRSLHGCLVGASAQTILITREPAACQRPVPVGAVWDGVWQTSANDPSLRVGLLGENGLRQLPNWRAANLPRAALLPSPAFWRDDALIAAPFAMPVEGCHVSRVVDWSTAVAGDAAR